MLRRLAAIATGQIHRWNELHRGFFGKYVPQCEELAAPEGHLILGSVLGAQMVLEIALAPNPKLRAWAPIFKRNLKGISQASFDRVGLTAAGAIGALCERDPGVRAKSSALTPVLLSTLALGAPGDSIVTKFRSMVLASAESDGAFEFLYGQLGKLTDASERTFTGLMRDLPYLVIALEQGANFAIGFARSLEIEGVEG